MTAKSIFLFANNFISSPVAQIDPDLFEWWMKSRRNCQSCVLLLQDDVTAKIPLAFTSLSRSFADTHCLAEIRGVDKPFKDTFHANKLPAVISFLCSDPKLARVYYDELNRDSLERFLKSNASNSRASPTSEVIGIEHLNSVEVCGDMCLISFVIYGKNMEPDMRNAIKTKVALKNMRNKRHDSRVNIPKLVWMSTNQVMYATLKTIVPDIDLVLWKVKRNRVAVLENCSETKAIATFIDEILSGSQSFISLNSEPEVLVLDGNIHSPLSLSDEQHSDPSIEQGGDSLISEDGQFVAPGHLTWTCPSNLMQERRKIRIPRQYHGRPAGEKFVEGRAHATSMPETDPISSAMSESDGLLL